MINCIAELYAQGGICFGREERDLRRSEREEERVKVRGKVIELKRMRAHGGREEEYQSYNADTYSS